MGRQVSGRCSGQLSLFNMSSRPPTAVGEFRLLSSYRHRLLKEKLRRRCMDSPCTWGSSADSEASTVGPIAKPARCSRCRSSRQTRASCSGRVLAAPVSLGPIRHRHSHVMHEHHTFGLVRFGNRSTWHMHTIRPRLLLSPWSGSALLARSRSQIFVRCSHRGQ